MIAVSASGTALSAAHEAKMAIMKPAPPTSSANRPALPADFTARPRQGRRIV
jgi:hypothetical protein